MTRNGRSHLRAYTLVDHDGMLLYRSVQHVTHNSVVEGKAMMEASLALHCRCLLIDRGYYNLPKFPASSTRKFGRTMIVVDSEDAAHYPRERLGRSCGYEQQ